MSKHRFSLVCALTMVAAGIGPMVSTAHAQPDARSRSSDSADKDRGRNDDRDRDNDRDRGKGRDHDNDHDHGNDHHGRPPEPIKVKIIGFNDYHGNLQTPGTFGVNTLVPAAQRPAVGGAEYLAAYVARMKAQNVNNVVVGAGDFIGASPLISALFFDEPAVETLNKIGVEFNAVGNHEFDKGSAELRRLQSGGCKVTGGLPDPNSCKGLGSNAPGTFDGARFKWLSANVVETATGRTLFPAYGIKSFQGAKVAFIGMTLKGTPGIVTPTGVAGLEFRDEAQTV
ncbi:hypothetical protein ACSFBL_35600, partial [Variovorax sp. GT1P44]